MALWDIAGVAAAFLWFLWHHCQHYSTMLQNLQSQQQPLAHDLPKSNEQQNQQPKMQTDLVDTVVSNTNTRICVSVEQMAPLLKKLYTDEGQLASNSGLDRIPTGDISWNEAVVAGLKISHDQVRQDASLILHCITDAVAATTNGRSDQIPNDRLTLTAPPETDSQGDNIADRVGPDAYVNYINLSELNPVIEAQMCFQTDELFEGNLKLVCVCVCF